MQSRLRSVVLLVVALMLLLVGNRKELLTTWEKWQEKKNNKPQKMDQIVHELKFDTQKVAYDSVHNTFKNDTFYFEILRLGNIDFSAQSSYRLETAKKVENASESF